MSAMVYSSEGSVESRCHIIATSVSPHKTGDITEHELAVFFGRVALAFGQESDGKTEASELLHVLLKTKISSDQAGQGIENDCRSDQISVSVFESWLYERFSQHPAHLEELVRVAKDLRVQNKTTANRIIFSRDQNLIIMQ